MIYWVSSSDPGILRLSGRGRKGWPQWERCNLRALSVWTKVLESRYFRGSVASFCNAC